MSLTTVAAATQILANAMKILNAARERAQTSKDAALKEIISKLYDEMAALKEAVQRLTDENIDLQRKRTAGNTPEPEIRQVGAVNYYFVGDKGPYCQPCYDDKQKLLLLTPAQEWSGGVRRRCLTCKQYFYEKPIDQTPAFGIARG